MSENDGRHGKHDGLRREARYGQLLVDQIAMKASIAIEERMNEDKAERDTGRRAFE
jgi:hypothetical protein